MESTDDLRRKPRGLTTNGKPLRGGTEKSVWGGPRACSVESVGEGGLGQIGRRKLQGIQNDWHPDTETRKTKKRMRKEGEMKISEQTLSERHSSLKIKKKRGRSGLRMID